MNENLSKKKNGEYIWIFKAMIYFIVLEIFLSLSGAFMLGNGANSGWMDFSFDLILIVGFFTFIPSALFAIGIALIKSGMSSAQKWVSAILIVLSTLSCIPVTLYVMLFSLISE